jgi:hypothetical protein
MNIKRENYACSICGIRLTRKFVHRKEDGSYICRPCRAVQRSAPRLERVREWLRLKLHRVGYTALFWGTGFAFALTVAYLIVTSAH